MSTREMNIPSASSIARRVLAAVGIIFIGLVLIISVYQILWCWLNPDELALREYVVESAEAYLGCNEGDGSHKPIIDKYNTQNPLPRGYSMQYTDSWCAAFVSVVMMDAGLTDWVPTECSCQEMIGLFQPSGDWTENDWYIPQIGDIIFYTWDDFTLGDCTGWADHVGIVAGTYGPVLKVIEGNRDDSVRYRYIWIGHPEIRGYGLPYYHKMVACGISPGN